jgi:pimeloyl-ACP methyl ester carboxylesterase
MKHREPKMTGVQGPAGRLMVTVEGEGGLPVLFVHGNAGDRTHWAEAQHHLASLSVAFDLRGLGESAGLHGPFGVEAAVEDIAAVADALLPERFVLVGHSFGAAAAGSYAAYYPERLAGLLYVDAAGDMRSVPEATREAYLANFRPENYGAFHEHWFAEPLLQAKESTRLRVMKSLRTSRREAVAGNFESQMRHDPGEAFESFHGPTHALAASTQPNMLVAQRPSLSRSVVTHTSHWLMLDAPEWFHTELSHFLARCRHELGPAAPVRR